MSKGLGIMKQEALPVVRYEVFEVRKSLVDPEVNISTLVGLRCPRCKVVGVPIAHSEERTCEQCGLHMKVMGASLIVTF